MENEFNIYPKQCPICDSELFMRDFMTVTCSNSCVEIKYFADTIYYDIFNKTFCFPIKGFLVKDYIDKNSVEVSLIKEKISYWKENDRYLMRTISGDKNV